MFSSSGAPAISTPASSRRGPSATIPAAPVPQVDLGADLAAPPGPRHHQRNAVQLGLREPVLAQSRDPVSEQPSHVHAERAVLGPAQAGVGGHDAEGVRAEALNRAVVDELAGLVAPGRV